MPVPISKNKYNKRGYNQTELIAKEIAKNLGIKLFERQGLIKIKDTPMQSTLNKTERKQNIKNVFKILNKDKLIGKKVVLFDDIYTTGSTAKECAKILKQAGASRILILTIAKD